MPYEDDLLTFEEWLDICCDYDPKTTTKEKLEEAYDDYCQNYYERGF